MSEEELVDAYSKGMISRRTFVRRLVAGGVSLVAAVTYADVLSPASAIASPAKGSEGKEDNDEDERHRHHHHHRD